MIGHCERALELFSLRGYSRDLEALRSSIARAPVHHIAGAEADQCNANRRQYGYAPSGNILVLRKDERDSALFAVFRLVIERRSHANDQACRVVRQDFGALQLLEELVAEVRVAARQHFREAQ